MNEPQEDIVIGIHLRAAPKMLLVYLFIKRQGLTQSPGLNSLESYMKLKDSCSCKKSYDQPRQHIKKQRHYFADKGPYSQSCGLSSSHVSMRESDYKEG